MRRKGSERPVKNLKDQRLKASIMKWMTKIKTNQKGALNIEMNDTIGAIVQIHNNMSSFVNKFFYYEKIYSAFLYSHVPYLYVFQLTPANLHNIIIYK